MHRESRLLRGFIEKRGAINWGHENFEEEEL